MPFGLYLHVPFCASRCDYCSFATWTDRHHLTEAYLAACRADADRLVAAGLPRGDLRVRRRRHAVDGARRQSSCAVLDRVPRAPGCEVTVECNPDTVTDELVDTYLAGGVTRLSFGVQSTSAHVLAALGRTHDRANVERSVELARRGGGAHVQPRRDLRRGRRVARGLVPHARRRHRPRAAPRVGAYALTVEAGTALAADPARHPDDDDQADKYLAAVERLEGAGLRLVRDLELGAARPRVPPQPPLLDDGGVPGGRVLVALAPRRAPVLEPAHAGPVHRRRHLRATPEAGDERLDAARRDLEALQLVAAHPGRRAASGARPRGAARVGGALDRGSRARWCSRCGAGCSPTRSRCGSRCRPAPDRARQKVPDSRSLSMCLATLGPVDPAVWLGIEDGVPVVGRRVGPDGRDRLCRTAAHLERAAHPGVVRVVASRPWEDGWELVTEHGGLPVAAARWTSADDVAVLGAAVATILADLHEREVVHGRLDASRILIGRSGTPVLCGLAAPAGPGEVAARPADDVADLGRVLRDLLAGVDAPGASEASGVSTHGRVGCAPLGARGDRRRAAVAPADGSAAGRRAGWAPSGVCPPRRGGAPIEGPWLADPGRGARARGGLRARRASPGVTGRRAPGVAGQRVADHDRPPALRGDRRRSDRGGPVRARRARGGPGRRGRRAAVRRGRRW